MACYRLRSKWVLLELAARKGVSTTGSGIARASGVPIGTINYVMNGRIPGNSTMAALTRLFDCSVEDLFELVEDVSA